jgi:hypothetical protein
MNQQLAKNENYLIMNVSSKIHKFNPHILETLEAKIQCIILNIIWGIKKCHVSSYTAAQAPHIEKQQLLQVNHITQYTIISFCMTTCTLDIVQLMAEPHIIINPLAPEVFLNFFAHPVFQM